MSLGLFSFFFFSFFSFAAINDFNGAVEINGCSGFLFRYPQSRPQDRALVMTAGHCASLGRPLKHREYAYQLESKVQVKILSGDGTKRKSIVWTRSLVYATMTDTDLAIYELEASYKDLRQIFQTDPLVLGAARPFAGLQVDVISSRLRKIYHCAVEAVVPMLVLEDYVWLDSIRYTRTGCKTVAGTSGAPVVNALTREVVGINNTGNDPKVDHCNGRNACEVNRYGEVTFVRGASYGQQTSFVLTCVDGSRNFDVQLPGCRLFH
jgi:V8-like Glu-specific endopeptidase